MALLLFCCCFYCKQGILSEIERQGQVFVVVPFVREVTSTAKHIQSLVPTVGVLEAHGEHEDLEVVVVVVVVVFLA